MIGYTDWPGGLDQISDGVGKSLPMLLHWLHMYSLCTKLQRQESQFTPLKIICVFFPCKAKFSDIILYSNNVLSTY